MFGLLEVVGHGCGPGKRFGRANESVSEGTEDGGDVGKKMTVEVNEAKKMLEVLHGGRLGIVNDGLDIRGEGGDARGSNMMAKEIHGRLGKGAFGKVDEKAVGSQNGEKLMKMVKVLLRGGAGHQDIIQVDENERKVMQDVVHQSLEGLSRVAEAKGHSEVLIEAKGSNNHRFRNVRRMDGNLVIAFYQIKLGENGGAMNAG